MNELLDAYDALMRKMPKPNFAIISVPVEVMDELGIVPGDVKDDTELFLEILRRVASG